MPTSYHQRLLSRLNKPASSTTSNPTIRQLLQRSRPSWSLSARSFSYRRTGGVRNLIAKRGIGVTRTGVPHIGPPLPSEVRAKAYYTIPPSTSIPSSSSGKKKGVLAGIPFLASLFSSKSSPSDKNMSDETSTSFPISKSDAEWRAVLSPAQFRVLRQQATEPAGTGQYDKHHPTTGVYTCAGCNTPLYTAKTKFSSGCGWPAFYDAIPGAVLRKEDRSFGVIRTEIICAACGGHLGHVFKGEGFDIPTDERHCVNSISLNFEEDEKKVVVTNTKAGDTAVQENKV